MNAATITPAIPPLDPSSERLWRESLGLSRLRPAWAKAEILIGLSCAALGLRLATGETTGGLAGGALFVLGGYLAMAGHRSHVDQAMNRQNAQLARLIQDHGPRDRDVS